MATSDDRINIILPPADQALADAIGLALGAAPKRGRSAALRFGLRCAAEKLGIAPPTEPKKKRAKKSA